MRSSRSALAFFLIATLVTHPCLAWSECGHNIIAILAFDLLPQSKQTRALELLQSHPRQMPDFQPKNPITDRTALNHWTIGRAGYWPDVARSQPEYHRSTWHYQLGSSLTIGTDVNVPATPGPVPTDATLATQDLYIAQAVELCRRTLRDDQSSDADKAIAICWIAHLVADAHQPCHAGSLYVEGIFPEGDRGANSIPTKQRRNLHALWDGLLGDRYDAGDIARRSSEIRSDRMIWTDATRAAPETDPMVWLNESSEFGRTHVYTPDVLAAVESAKVAGAQKVETVVLAEDYLKSAGALAQKRAAFAAHRLARILEEDLE